MAIPNSADKFNLDRNVSLTNNQLATLIIIVVNEVKPYAISNEINEIAFEIRSCKRKSFCKFGYFFR